MDGRRPPPGEDVSTPNGHIMLLASGHTPSHPRGRCLRDSSSVDSLEKIIISIYGGRGGGGGGERTTETVGTTFWEHTGRFFFSGEICFKKLEVYLITQRFLFLRNQLLCFIWKLTFFQNSPSSLHPSVWNVMKDKKDFHYKVYHLYFIHYSLWKVPCKWNINTGAQLFSWTLQSVFPVPFFSWNFHYKKHTSKNAKKAILRIRSLSPRVVTKKPSSCLRFTEFGPQLNEELIFFISFSPEQLLESSALGKELRC